MVLWGRSILGRQKVPLEGLSKGFGILGIHTTGARMAPNLPFADLSKREKTIQWNKITESYSPGDSL